MPQNRTAVATRNIRMMHVLERVAARFNRAGVPLMVLKGAALHLALPDDPGRRAMDDLDLLVKPRDASRARSLLEELGALRGAALVREDFFPHFHYETEYLLGRIHAVKIDLHVRPFRPLRYARLLPQDAFWDRAETRQLSRGTVHVPSCEDMLIHLTAHAAFHGSVRGKWLEDIARWVAGHPHLDWARFLAAVRRFHLAWPVRRGLRRSSDLHGPVCPAEILQQLDAMPVTWRDRLTLWHAPRDARHPAGHVAISALCTPDVRFAVAYLQAVLLPERAHMADWYPRRHPGWLPAAHAVRWLSPVLKRVPRLWHRFAQVETAESPIHGTGVFATRDIAAGEVISHYHGQAVSQPGTYTAEGHEGPEATQWYEITGKLQFLNHSCQPNAELEGFILIARRAVRAGEEITIDYGPTACSCRSQKVQQLGTTESRVA